MPQGQQMPIVYQMPVAATNQGRFALGCMPSVLAMPDMVPRLHQQPCPQPYQPVQLVAGYLGNQSMSCQFPALEQVLRFFGVSGCLLVFRIG